MYLWIAWIPSKHSEPVAFVTWCYDKYHKCSEYVVSLNAHNCKNFQTVKMKIPQKKKCHLAYVWGKLSRILNSCFILWRMGNYIVSLNLFKDTWKLNKTRRVLLKLVSMCHFPLFQVGVPETLQYSPLPDSRQLSFLYIATTLNPMHFNNGQLNIRCTAHVSTLYHETSEVHLMSRTREPIPERGRLTKQVNKCIPSVNYIAGNVSSLFNLH